MCRTRRIWLICSLLALAVTGIWARKDGNLRVFDAAAAHEPAQAQQAISSSTVSQTKLFNTFRSYAELVRDQRTILLENAVWDTRLPIGSIPESLRARGEPGVYIVQWDGLLAARFRSLLAGAGAEILGYIPNSSYLVKASAAQVRALAAEPNVTAVLPYEPFYKLKGSLLNRFLADAQSTAEVSIDILLFSGEANHFTRHMIDLGASVVSEEMSAVGTIVTAECSLGVVGQIAQSQEVQAIQASHARKTAVDLTRVRLGVSRDPACPTNYLGLTGTNVLIGIADSGFDMGHSDLSGRMIPDSSAVLADVPGHGTHVAGVIAGSGVSSTLVDGPPGSPGPVSEVQFRGVASGASLYCMGLSGTNPISNTHLQSAVAATNALVSNNSWIYEGAWDYDFAAASYDAASRDALPGVPGLQPVLFVFPSGNGGNGTESGSGGEPGTVASPGTAKNVLTVGSLESGRSVAAEVITCEQQGTNTVCLTNTPWLGATDNPAQVASFSGRGNVGVGVEGLQGRFKPDLVAPGTFISSCLSAEWDAGAYYGNSQAGVVLSNLNVSAGDGVYRMESGTSLSAAAVSGTLGLIQEFIASKFAERPTPALLKALLINGARLEAGSSLAFSSPTNLNGWGVVDLPGSLHPGLTNAGCGVSSAFFDQSHAVSTGEEVTYPFEVLGSAEGLPLSVTLVWTDPPANPAAGVKLVNDLDLIVTNLETGEVFFGNNFAAGSIWSASCFEDPEARPDCVNNVEKIRISSATLGRYSVTIRGRGVNVNGGGKAFDQLAQDYAVVFSTPPEGRLEMNAADAVLSPAENLVVLSNRFTLAGEFGTVLASERIGSHAPGAYGALLPLGSGEPPSTVLLGESNQWRFFVITNETDYTNCAFVLFDPASVSVDPVAKSSPSADVDLYVSQDPGLLSLDPASFAAAWRSIRPGCNESIVRNEGMQGTYYIAVKCESAFAADFGMAVFFCEQPFETDLGDYKLLRAVPAPGVVPAGSVQQLAFALPSQDQVIRRLVVSNAFSRTEPGDFKSWLSEGSDTVLIEDVPADEPCGEQHFLVDDTSEGDWQGAVPSATPGALRKWSGKTVSGPWIFRYASSGGATNVLTELAVYPQTTNDFAILSGAERFEYFEAPAGVTNISLRVDRLSGSGLLRVEVVPVQTQSNSFNRAELSTNGSAMIVVDASSEPPVQSGPWAARLKNEGLDPVEAHVSVSFESDPSSDPFLRVRRNAPGTILDAAVTVYDIPVTNVGTIESIQAGVHLAHPRLGDLSLTLVSPSGERVLLQSGRGGSSPDGLGCSIVVSNIFPQSSAGGPLVASNTYNLKRTHGNIEVHYDFYELDDWMRIYYETNIIFDTGLTHGSLTTNIFYGPGAATQVTVVMNEGNNSDPDTAWFYTVSSSYPDHAFFTFSDEPEAVPVKFAVPPLNTAQGARGLTCKPEESLSRFAGLNAEGTWKLEIRDAYEGPQAPAELIEVELAFLLGNIVPVPATISSGIPVETMLWPSQTRWFQVETQPWTSWITNCLVQSDQPLTLLFSDAVPGTGSSVVLLENVQSGCSALDLPSWPQLVAGRPYYLGVVNTNEMQAAFTLRADVAPQVIALYDGMLASDTNLPPGQSRYYSFNVSELSQRVQFQVTGLSGDAQLYARRGLPLPNNANADAFSDAPGTGEESIVLLSEGAPATVLQGTWFLSVLNAGETPIQYEVQARQWRQTGRPLAISDALLGNGEICLSWNCLPGIGYRVLSCTNLTEDAWTDAVMPFVPQSTNASVCLPADLPAQFFRIEESLLP